ncbi:MAG: leucyl aminopeptidase [Pseudonocardiales bacterium]|jgi:leucyl aminopeptidase|nr:leucyl aminopeptidase [Pseudonocardiales bacterium]MDT4973948.1 leucyl aminopeptidase [Pseudonocardiales bacterium]MDT4975452.1 leucyl aminopeptidase [Pseudonocardiales bacterium]MDT4980107.1 leucyl aminopeptidase [Pseudonocardiales bacterium]
MTAVSLADPSAQIAADAVVVGVVSSSDGPQLAPGAKPVDAALGTRLVTALKAAGASGKPDEVTKIPTLGLAPFGLVVATGLGPDAKQSEQVRRGVGAALRALTGKKHVHIAIDAPLDAVAEGALLGTYAFTTYKSSATKPALRKITIAAKSAPAATAALRRARIVAEAVFAARDFINTPPNDLYPESFAARASEHAATQKLSVEVLDPRALARGKFGGILAVGSGSTRLPRLVRITYRPTNPKARIALVGKGITFDSGGLNIKTANMAAMTSDMSGAAAVVAAVVAIAALKLPVEVTATVPMAENLPSGSAYRPSDVLTMRNGQTVEVSDTDAEGRLVLADGIARALEDDPDYLIEASTLTGAQVVALGTRVIGAMGEAGLRDRVAAAGNAAGELVWAMPLPDEMRSGLDSPFADISSLSSEKGGGMLVAGLFLADFMPEGQPWVHLDIAGPAWNSGGARDYTPKGATGAAVRTIIAAAEDLAGR